MKNEDYTFIIDVGVGRIIESWLQQQKFSVIGIRSLNPEMADTDIIELANKEDAIIITMDKDFGELVYHSEKAHAGVLLLRLEDATGEEKVEVIRFIIDNFKDLLEHKFCVFKNGRLRIR